MKTNDIDKLFEGLDFDIAEPLAQHELRFESKLLNRKKGRNSKTFKLLKILGPGLAVAAGLFLAMLIYQDFLPLSNSEVQGLARVSPEMKHTHEFYTSVIQQEIASLKELQNEDTKNLISDALSQLQILERDYTRLKTDLEKSGHDKRVIYAMIKNFQQRIDLLQTVLEKVNSVQSLKNNNYENSLL